MPTRKEKTNLASHSATLVAHQFDDLEQQHDAATLGMWIFLATEVLLFGGLFAAFAVFRLQYPKQFAAGSHTADVVIGTVNTGVLLCSSLTMALAVHAAQAANRRRLLGFLAATIVLGGVFLGFKSYEYSEKYHHHHVPLPSLRFAMDDFSLESETLPEAVKMYFALYFAMTGLHAAHMVIGMGLLAWMAVLAWRGGVLGEAYVPVEMTGLYWHFIDIVWIYLFPLLYLLDRL
jgi:cytochrome c oxidase subunit 3